MYMNKIVVAFRGYKHSHRNTFILSSFLCKLQTQDVTGSDELNLRVSFRNYLHTLSIVCTFRFACLLEAS